MPPSSKTQAAAFSLEARGISKRFGGTQALDDATLTLRPGSINALLGGNGSGKSTIVKCLTGVYRADEGEVLLHGRTMSARDISPVVAHRAGIRVVHQDLALFDRASIAENFAFADRFPTTPLGSVSWSRLNRRVAQILEQHSIPARPTDLVGGLRPAQKTLVAIARALQDQQDQPDQEMVLLLDEPTASLPEREVALLFEALRERASQGQSLAIVTHRLSEVLAVADDITVFRDGRVVGALPAATADHDELLSLLAGPTRQVQEVGTAGENGQGQPGAGRVAVELQQVSAPPLADADLVVHEGEIVGVAGLLGSGRSTLLNVIFGCRKPTSGMVRVNGLPLQPGDVAGAMAAGVALVPENRLRDAAFSTVSVRENVSAAVIKEFWRLWMRAGRERAEAQRLARKYAIKTRDVEQPYLHLSGGNQQKVILARWLRRKPRILLLDEPTQGVDAVARMEIYRAIRDAADEGCAIIVASSDHDELALLCHRVVVLQAGRVGGHLSHGTITPDAITRIVQSVSASLEPVR